MGLLYSVYSSIFGGGADDGVPDPVTGLTPREKQAICASWALIQDKKVIRQHGVEFFVMLFTEYPYMQEIFTDFKGLTAQQLRKDRTMYSHSITVMYSIGSLVENVDVPEQLALVATKIARTHIARSVGVSYFKDLATMFPKFLDARAGPAATPFVKDSWSKFLGVLNSVVEQEENEAMKT